MDGLARASGAPVVINFNGEDLILDPMTLRDYGAIEQEILRGRPNVIEKASEAAKKISDEADEQARQLLSGDAEPTDAVKAAAKRICEQAQKRADALMNKAFEHAGRNNSVDEDELFGWLDSVAGLSFCCWFKFEGRYPGRFTLNEVRSIIQNFGEEQMKELIEARDRASAQDIAGNSTGLSSTTEKAPTAPQVAASPGV
jgi:hypothetical protein